MATPRDAQRMQETAKRMKAMGIVRKIGRCPVCTKIVSLPIDNHFYNSCN